MPTIQRERVVRTCAKAYRDRMRTLAAMRELDLWYAETRIDQTLEPSVDPKFAQTIRATAVKARSRDNLAALSKLTQLVDGRRRLVSDPPLLVPIDELVGEADARRHETAHGRPHRRLSKQPGTPASQRLPAA